MLKDQDAGLVVKTVSRHLELKPAVLLALLVKQYRLGKVHLSVIVLGVSKVR